MAAECVTNGIETNSELPELKSLQEIRALHPSDRDEFRLLGHALAELCNYAVIDMKSEAHLAELQAAVDREYGQGDVMAYLSGLYPDITSAMPQRSGVLERLRSLLRMGFAPVVTKAPQQIVHSVYSYGIRGRMRGACSFRVPGPSQEQKEQDLTSLMYILRACRLEVFDLNSSLKKILPGLSNSPYFVTHVTSASCVVSSRDQWVELAKEHLRIMQAGDRSDVEVFPSIARLAMGQQWWAVLNLCRRRVLPRDERLARWESKTAIEWAEHHREWKTAEELRYFSKNASNLAMELVVNMDARVNALDDKFERRAELALNESRQLDKTSEMQAAQIGKLEALIARQSEEINASAGKMTAVARENNQLKLEWASEKVLWEAHSARIAEEREKLSQEMAQWKLEWAEQKNLIAEERDGVAKMREELAKDREALRSQLLKSVQDQLSLLPTIVSSSIGATVRALALNGDEKSGV